MKMEPIIQFVGVSQFGLSPTDDERVASRGGADAVPHVLAIVGALTVGCADVVSGALQSRFDFHFRDTVPMLQCSKTPG